MNQPEVKTVDKQDKKQHQNGMVALTREIEHHHMQPAPQAKEPELPPFPPVLWQGSGAGILIGALLGLLFGIALYRGLVVVPGWEGIFSLGPFTFHFFWTMMGAALGLLLGGVGTILAANSPVREAEANDIHTDVDQKGDKANRQHPAVPPEKNTKRNGR